METCLQGLDLETVAGVIDLCDEIAGPDQLSVIIVGWAQDLFADVEDCQQSSADFEPDLLLAVEADRTR